MKNKILSLALGLMLFSIAVLPTYAAEKVKDIYVSIVPDEDSSFSPGEIEAGFEPTVNTNQYYIDEYDTSSSTYTPRKSYTYTMDIIPESGYSFDGNVKVIVEGAVEVTIKSKSSNKLVVKAKTYPMYVLDNPSNVVVDQAKKEATWDKVEYAKKYNVVVKYTNKNGDEKETKKSVTKNEIDLSGYIGKYEDVSVSVQSVKGTTEGDKFLSNSDYISSKDGGIDNNLAEDEYEFAIPSKGSDGSTGSSSNSSGSTNQTPGTSSSGKEGWNGSGESWYYVKDGKRITGWLGLNGEWYLMDSNGNMKSGWQYIDSNWFFLNTNHDGTFGKMLAGWQNIGGTWYYLNTSHDGTYGAMYSNRVTPDGYKVGVNGAWIR